MRLERAPGAADGKAFGKHSCALDTAQSVETASWLSGVYWFEWGPGEAEGVPWVKSITE